MRFRLVIFILATGHCSFFLQIVQKLTMIIKSYTPGLFRMFFVIYKSFPAIGD